MAGKRFLQIALVLAIVAASLAFPHGAAAWGNCGSVYIVQPGDWLVKIANFCGVTLADLYAANPGVAYQLYIYPGQALNIPGAPAPYVPPPYYPPSYPTQPSYIVVPSMTVAPHVGSNYYFAYASIGHEVIFQVTVRNNGIVPLQLVANLVGPDGWEYVNNNNDCPDKLGVGSSCTFTWYFVPQTLGNVYARVYVRGLYIDINGIPARVTHSPAFLFIVDN